ncbi:hypothetical protein [Sinomicrobium sp.]
MLVEAEYNHFDFQDAQYFGRVRYADDKNGFLGAVKRAFPAADEKHLVILVPKKGDFESRFGYMLPWIFGSFGIGALVVLTMIAILGLDNKEPEKE